MALPSIRMEFRVALANVDRGVQVDERVVLARHPSETMERVVLRVLAWCALHREGMTFGPGLCEPDAPDLFVKSGDRYLAWIACGSAKWEMLRRNIRANAGVEVHVVLADTKRRDVLREEMSRDAKEARAVSIWTFDRGLVAPLAEREDRRRRWEVTISGDHCWVVEDEATFDGPIEIVRGDEGDY